MTIAVSTPNGVGEISEGSSPMSGPRQFSVDVPPRRAGPGFLRLGSTPYRLEMLLVTLAILVLLFYWRFFVVRDLNLPLTIFWIVWPDLGSFIPIGLAARSSKDWPKWGPWLYNALHTFLVWIPVFAIWSLATGSIQ